MSARKAKNRDVDSEYLVGRINGLKAAGFGKTKWIEFCETMLSHGFGLKLYEAKKTVSKYITVICKETGRSFKVRFSNHRPIREREMRKDCDFFVGKTNFSVTNTDQAVAATLKYFRAVDRA